MPAAPCEGRDFERAEAGAGCERHGSFFSAPTRRLTLLSHPTITASDCCGRDGVDRVLRVFRRLTRSPFLPGRAARSHQR